MILTDRSMCIVPHQDIVLPLFTLLLKSLCGVRVGIKYVATYLAYIIKSNPGSKERSVILVDQDVHVYEIFSG